MTVPETTAKDGPIEIDALRRVLLDTVSASESRLTPKALEKRLKRQFSIPKGVFKTAVEHLVSEGELVYTYLFGCSFLEKSFNRPVRITKTITLTPHDISQQPSSGEIIVKLQHGASFGTGDHPTTRLAARGIEQVLSTGAYFHKDMVIHALDIGTGSGILAIIAVLLGVKTAVGIDIDPCAISEAKKNITLNHIEEQIEVFDRPLEHIDATFSMITANLRYPTLKGLSPLLAERTEKGGVVVVSGVRTDEVSGLVETYEKRQFRCIWEEIEKGWAGLVFENQLSGVRGRGSAFSFKDLTPDT